MNNIIVIAKVTGERYEIPIEEIETLTFSEVKEETPVEESSAEEVIVPVNDTETTSEPVIEEEVIDVLTEEETPSEPVSDAKEEVIEDAPVEKKDDAISDAIDEIVDMVSESISKADDVPVSEVPVNAVGTEEDMIPTSKEEVVAVATDTSGSITVMPAEPKKEETPATVSFTEV